MGRSRNNLPGTIEDCDCGSGVTMMQGNFQASDFENKWISLQRREIFRRIRTNSNFPFQQRGYPAASRGENNHSGEIKH
jgi:hypothetical protein